MNVKIDTKERFHVITVTGPILSADMAGELSGKLQSLLNNPIKNVVLSLSELSGMDELAAEMLVKTQQNFYEHNASFVICEMRKEVEDFLDSKGLLELMNCTPTPSEAWDIVQMEELERELLD